MITRMDNIDPNQPHEKVLCVEGWVARRSRTKLCDKCGQVARPIRVDIRYLHRDVIDTVSFCESCFMADSADHDAQMIICERIRHRL